MKQTTNSFISNNLQFRKQSFNGSQTRGLKLTKSKPDIKNKENVPQAQKQINKLKDDLREIKLKLSACQLEN